MHYVDFLYFDEETGISFFVELSYNPEADPDLRKTRVKADEIAAENFEAPQFCGIYDPEDAEALGYDTF